MTSVLRIACPTGYEAERRYVVEVVFGEFLGLGTAMEAENRHDVEITAPSTRSRLVLADVLFQVPEDEWLKPESLPTRPLTRWDLDTTPIDATVTSPLLPVLYGAPLRDGSLYAEADGEIRLGLDLLGSAFFALTRYEELVERERDTHERFPSGAMLAYREGFLGRPIVNEYVEVLWWALRRLWPRLARRKRAFVERPTHDVDAPFAATTTLRRLVRAAGGDVLVRHDFRLAAKRLRASAARRHDLDRDLNNTFDLIMTSSEERGLRSTFYFMAAHPHEFDLDYSLDHPWIRKLLRRVHERGHEIGLHPSYLTLGDPEQTRHEFETLVAACEEEGIHQEAWGGRQHYLRWANPETWQNYEDAGLAHDASLGHSDATGFRCGVCREYPAFNLETRRALQLRERPLVVMEMAVMDQPATLEQAVAEIAELKSVCAMFDGEFTMLWHNNRLLSTRDLRAYDAALRATVNGGPNSSVVRSTIERHE